MHMHFRSIWISDTHLGGKNLKSEQLLEFLQSTESEYLYLVGDIFDFWKLKRKWFWSPINNRIIDLILDKARDGTQVFYLPGNHDAVLRNYAGTTFNGIKICNEIVHTAADHSRYLVLHGDQFDCIVQNKEWLAGVGSYAYEILLNINRWYNRLRELRGKPYHSISAAIKHSCKRSVNYISNYEQELADVVQEQKVDGIICGHIHHASIKTMDNFLYSNSGDWVESCTALAENQSGTLGLVQWMEVNPVTVLSTDKKHEKNRYSDRCLAPTN